MLTYIYDLCTYIQNQLPVTQENNEEQLWPRNSLNQHPYMQTYIPAIPNVLKYSKKHEGTLGKLRIIRARWLIMSQMKGKDWLTGGTTNWAID